MQGLRERQKEARRQQILVAARELIAGGGVEAMTMRAVAERSGLSVPTIYNLVGDRHAVVAALMAAGGQQFEDAVADLPRDPLAALLRLGDAVTDVIGARRDVVAAVLADHPPVGLAEVRHGVVGRYGAKIELLLTAGRDAGIIDPTADPVILRDRVLCMAAGSVAAWANHHGDEALLRDDLAHAMLLVLLAHIDRSREAEVRVLFDQRTRRLRRRASSLRRASADAKVASRG